VAVLPQRMMCGVSCARAIRELGIELDAVDTHPETIRIRETAFVGREARGIIGMANKEREAEFSMATTNCWTRSATMGSDSTNAPASSQT